MNLNENFPVSPQKIQDLKNRIQKLQININEIDENFIRGSGHGGQKINKTSNCVVLSYPKLNLIIKNQESRQRSLNRFLALRELIDQIELKISPETSQKLKAIAKIIKQKKRRTKRSMIKYESA